MSKDLHQTVIMYETEATLSLLYMINSLQSIKSLHKRDWIKERQKNNQEELNPSQTHFTVHLPSTWHDCSHYTKTTQNRIP